MEQPYGRGVNIQIVTNELDLLINRLEATGINLYEGKKEITRDLCSYQRKFSEFLVQDPDGYLLRFQQRY
jgi:hypothetical protein